MSCVSGARDQSPLQPNPNHQMEPGTLPAPPEPIRTSSYSQQKENPSNVEYYRSSAQQAHPFHLLIHLQIEEEDEGRWCLWRPDHAGFDSRSIFASALIEE